MWVKLKKDRDLWLNLDKVDYICQNNKVWQVYLSNKTIVLVFTPPNEFELAKVAPCVTPE